MASLLILLLAIVLLIVLILYFRVPAFIALLGIAIVTGLALGGASDDVLISVQDGMGGTLGFVAVVVGLGALLGGMLELTGGVRVVARSLLGRVNGAGVPWALGMTGFLVAIPVFFDVAFIILVPLVYALARESGRSVRYYGVALLAGLSVTHAFIPPTPGPVAVAEVLGADLGLVILFGFLAGLPAMCLAGPVFASRFRALPAEAFLDKLPEPAGQGLSPRLHEPLILILFPILLILSATAGGQWLEPGILLDTLQFLGHPFTALLLTCALAWQLMHCQLGAGRDAVLPVLQKSLEPAGIVVLVTGAGGAFKQVLVDSGIGKVLTDMLGSAGSMLYLFAFLVALLMRVSQGSATVAMITAAGLTAPLLEGLASGAGARALLVIAIASGATACSHVNDSGFWLVSRYLHMNEADTLKSWTVLTTLIGLSGFAVVLLLSLFVGS